MESQFRAPAIKPDCFATSSSSTDFLDGRWLLHNTGGDEGHYRLSVLRRSVELPAHTWYDLCYKQAVLNRSALEARVPVPIALQPPEKRAGYAWVPSRCALAPIEPLSGCSSLLGRSILFVGDSVLFQLFCSFALQLNATFEARRYGSRSENRVNASITTRP